MVTVVVVMATRMPLAVVLVASSPLFGQKCCETSEERIIPSPACKEEPEVDKARSAARPRKEVRGSEDRARVRTRPRRFAVNF